MSEKNWQFELEEYIKQGEPEKQKKAMLGAPLLVYRQLTV